MKPIEGEPAFPSPPVGTGDSRDGMTTGSPGMSLREWYIGQALAGYCASHQYCGVEYGQLAKIAIAQADAVMQQLYPQPKETEQ